MSNEEEGNLKTLSNADFKKFIAAATPVHPSMAVKKEDAKSSTDSFAVPAPKKQPSSSSSASSSHQQPMGGELKFSDGEMKTVKLTKRGLEEEGAADDEEDASAQKQHAPPGPGGHQQRVLSSRERSYIAYQEKQRAKMESKTKYRDRAKERQMDANPDYKFAEDDPMNAAAATGGLSPSQVSYEASKYLGGDIAHTHLVKGLDYALLNKVKQELEKKEEEKMEEAIRQQQQHEKGEHVAGAEVKKSSDTAADAASAEQKRLAAASEKAGVNFHSLRTASIFNLIMTPSPLAIASLPQPSASAATSINPAHDAFLPGRMAYVIPLQARPEVGVSDLAYAQINMNKLPSTVNTSVNDLESTQANYKETHCLGALPATVYHATMEAFGRRRLDEEERRKRRKERAERGAAAGFNVTREDHEKEEEEKLAQAIREAEKAAAAAAQNPAMMDTTEHNQAVPASAPMAGPAPPPADDNDGGMDYSVAKPPPANDDDDDDGIFADAGHDYQALPAEPDYSVPRPPPDDEDEDAEMAPAAAASSSATSSSLNASLKKSQTASLFASSAGEPAIRALDPQASRVVSKPVKSSGDGSSSEEDDDIFDLADGGGDMGTGAGDELLGIGSGGASSSSMQPSSKKPLSEEDKKRKRDAMMAEAEYESLFPSSFESFSNELEEEEDDGASSSKKTKAAAAAEEEKKKNANSESENEQRFNSEYHQVSLLLKARGVKLKDDNARRQTKPTTNEDEERALKRQKILRGFAQK